MSVLLKSIYVGRRAFARIHQEVLFVSVNVASHSIKLGLAVKVGTIHSTFNLALSCFPSSSLSRTVIEGGTYGVSTKTCGVSMWRLKGSGVWKFSNKAVFLSMGLNRYTAGC